MRVNNDKGFIFGRTIPLRKITLLFSTLLKVRKKASVKCNFHASQINIAILKKSKFH